MSRLRIGVGILLLALSVSAQRSPLWSYYIPQRLPIANASGWSSSVVLWQDAYATNTAIVTWTDEGCKVGPCAATSARVFPGGTASVTLPWIAFGTVPAPEIPVKVRLEYNGATHQSYVVGRMLAVTKEHTVSVQPVESSAAKFTCIAAFTSKPTDLTVTEFDGSNQPVGKEYVSVFPPVSQQCLANRFTGRIEISAGGFLGFPSDEPVWGFVSVASPDGGNAEVIEFR